MHAIVLNFLVVRSQFTAAWQRRASLKLFLFGMKRKVIDVGASQRVVKHTVQQREFCSREEKCRQAGDSCL